MRVLVVVAALAGCTQHQVRVAHTTSEVVTAAGLVGVLACGIAAAADPADDSTILKVGVAFVPVSLIGALVFITTNHDEQVEPPQVTRRERRRAAAWELTKQAEQAAREEDCTQVQAIAPRVRDLDSDFHGSVFMRDVAIQRCLREF